MNDATLWYFADPMCSWCWGFSPVINAIRENYQGRMKVALILGGLRPRTKQPMSSRERDDILHHWHDVQAMTGQPFNFDGVLNENFIYDTEPASRAVVAMSQVDTESVFPLFKAIQAAFYAEGLDVTQPETLLEVAASLGINRADFMTAFESDTARDKTLAHFQMARRLGVRGFPTLVLQQGKQHQLLCNGYRHLEDLQAAIEDGLTGADVTPA